MLDLKDEKDLKIAIKEIKTADIFISNFRNKSAKKLGLNYKSIKKINPKNDIVNTVNIDTL